MTLAPCELTVDWNAPRRPYLHHAYDVVRRRETPRETLRVNL